MVALTNAQKDIVATDGHQLVIGGPGSGKTTVSILKAGNVAKQSLHPNQRVLFLSFARASVSRVLEAILEERDVTDAERQRIEVDTYHSFFWSVLKTHGYLVGLPRRLTILTPPNEAIALSAIRSQYGADKNLTEDLRIEKREREQAEQNRLADEEGRVCFDLFGDRTANLLEGSQRVGSLISTMYPYIILDEFQDTNADQWRVVKALGQWSTLLALADPEQRIFDFIGADPARLDHFKEAFDPVVHDLAGDNHRSKGTDIAAFGNDILTGKFRAGAYQGIVQARFASNANQAFATLVAQVLQARTRLITVGKRGWSLAILVPTKRLTRFVSDKLREPFNNLPPIAHSAAVDTEGPILAAEVIAFLLQPNIDPKAFDELVGLLCGYFHGKGGGAPSKGNLETASRLNSALVKWNDCIGAGKAPPGNSMLRATSLGFEKASAVPLTGDPDRDWRAVRAALEASDCTRLQEIAKDVRNVRLLERGSQLRDGLSRNWREYGAYLNALAITRQAFVQEHFASANRPENGVVVMNMHKAKGKQFDEVIIFEGAPVRVKGKIVANPDRIVRENTKAGATASARQNFRVSVTRAKSRTTILTPADDPCVLLLPG